MDFYVTDHLSNAALRVDLKASDGSESKAVARMLSRIGEYDERRLYHEDGYPSMHAYCVGELKYTRQRASKRIYAARTARKFPVLFIALADGRLHLTGLLMLARHLRPGNLDELLAAATRKTADEIALLIAERFPRPDLPERLEEIPPPAVATIAAHPAARFASLPQEQYSARNTGVLFLNATASVEPAPAAPAAPVPTHEYSARNTVPSALPSRITPLAPGRFSFQCTVDQETQDLWEYAKALLSHEIPTGEMALVLKAILKLAVPQLDKRKFAATNRPGHSRGCVDPRHIPAAVKREVRVRDDGKCTFVGENGKRCGSRHRLEFHHDQEFACGGASTAKNLRLMCGRTTSTWQSVRSVRSSCRRSARRGVTAPTTRPTSATRIPASRSRLCPIAR